jgi:hypothetical protein
MPVPRADAAPCATLAVNATALISRPPQRGVEFGFQKLLDEAADARPYPVFQRIEPIIAQKMPVLDGAGGRLYAIPCHGVISIGALTPIWVWFHKPDTAQPSNSNHIRDGTLPPIRNA